MKTLKFMLLLVLAVVLYSCDDDVNQPTINDTPEEVETSIFEKVNNYRTSQGVAVFTRDETVDELCQEHCDKMASGDIPYGNDGEETRKEALGITGSVSYKYSEFVSKNLGYEDPASVIFNDWLEDDDKESALGEEFQRVGIGCARAEDGTYYVTFIMVQLL